LPTEIWVAVFTDIPLIEKLTMVLVDVSSVPPAKTDSHDMAFLFSIPPPGLYPRAMR
jgi:hypothetical protein